MFNTNWPLNQNAPAANVDWGALADSWMQQREQQAQWQQVPPPLPPPPPAPPQFLLSGPPIPPPGPPPMGMSFPPLPPGQVGMAPHYHHHHHHHHQLQVGSHTTQESLTMTNIENAPWRPQPPPPPPSFITPNGSSWRPHMNNQQQQQPFPMQSEPTASFGNRNFWPPIAPSQPVPPPLPPPVPPPVPPVPPVVAPPFSSAPYQHSPAEKRISRSTFNTSIPSLMDLPTTYGQNHVPAPLPVPPKPVLPSEPPPVRPTPALKTPIHTPSVPNATAKRRKIPAWVREELGRIEKEKQKKIENTSSNSLSLNDSSSKFDDNDEDDEDDDETHRTLNGSSPAFSDDDDDENNNDDDGIDADESLVASTPIVTRRSRFDDDRSTESQLNVSAISKRAPSPVSSSTLIEDDSIDPEEQFMMRLRRTLTELLLEVTNEELILIAKEIYLQWKEESSTPVIRTASGLSSLIQSFSGTDSDDEDVHSMVNTTVISKSPVRTTSKQLNNQPVSDNSNGNTAKQPIADETKSAKSKRKKSTKDRSRSPSNSPSRDHRAKKQHLKKHRHSSSPSSSSTSSPSHSQKRKKSSSHNEHRKSKKHDDRARKR